MASAAPSKMRGLAELAKCLRVRDGLERLPPPVAGACGRRCRCWYPAPRRSGCRSRPSPASDASAFNRMRAFNTWRAGRLPVWISALSRSRSSALSFTMYLFTAGCFAITTHLRATGDIDSEIGRRINDAGYSHVRHFKQQAQKIFACLFKRFSMAATGQSRRHDHETTVDHALIRGLVTAGPVIRRGASSV